MSWRIELNCGCIYVVVGAPDLSKPRLCLQYEHGLTSIITAERYEHPATAAACDTITEAAQ